MAKSSLAHTPTANNKSWVELCDEDYSSDSSMDENEAEQKSNGKYKELSNSKDKIKNDFMSTDNVTEIKIKNEPIEEYRDENTPNKISKDECRTKDIKAEIPVKTEKEESPWRFSYATILKNSASKDNANTPPNSSKPISVKKEVPVKTKENETIKSVKREIQREFLQDDLSLTSHLDVFHMQSPHKLASVDEEMASPFKIERDSRSAKRRVYDGGPTSPSLSLSEDAVLPDDVLMPSPQKVTRLSSRRKREPGESPLVCKRSKQSSSRHNTPRCVVPVDPQPVELEEDEQILSRRQKQIDYGKNTIGYERYCQMVPKHKRVRKHPSTPPKHLKYSRRAWDGLVRQWRQQLHFWDPPGSNLDDLDMSSVSEASSDTASITSSLPATPKGECKVRRSTRTTRSSASESSSIAEDPGCSPLKDI